MSFVLTFLNVTKQAKDLTLNGANEYQTKSIGNEGVGSIWLVKIEKNDLTVNKLEENRDQALKSWPKGEMQMWGRGHEFQYLLSQDPKDCDRSLHSKRNDEWTQDLMR